jgi:hypothetical protein
LDEKTESPFRIAWQLLNTPSLERKNRLGLLGRGFIATCVFNGGRVVMVNCQFTSYDIHGTIAG